MNITSLKPLAIPDVRVIKYARFKDKRGYFTELFRKSDIVKLKDITIAQANESYSKKHTIRGLHFQWNPFMGKLVRTLSGHMIDITVDIRRNSPTFGKGLLFDMPKIDEGDGVWIWIPPGFAHGNIFLKNTIIEYFCTGEYSQDNEACISPFATDIDWKLTDKKLLKIFRQVVADNPNITEKDKNGQTLSSWEKDASSKNFIYGKC